jgi:LuxR family maltose regulon positive regulatory protein
VKTTPAVGVGRRRIIKRPRLTRMLDESGARIILLVAPAGYGKTTLAREWLDERRATWYHGGPASADVAALAVGLATAAAEVVPGAGDRMRQRLRATDRPEDDARILAEMLAEDLVEWPQDAWLAIDDYHFASDALAPEAFVGALAGLAPVRLLIASRRRPSWAKARLRLYGHMLEVDQTLLAMNDQEALNVLSQRRDAPTLVDQAAGWPAVIGLAALTVRSRIPSDDVPSALFDYFAEELLQASDRDTQVAVCRLAVAPSITAASATHLLGSSAARTVLAESVSAGILLAQSGDQFELHPLLRTFLHERLQGFDEDLMASTVKRVGVFLLDHRRWDDALSLAQKSRDPTFLEDLIASAWEPMLDEGRLATLSSLEELSKELRLRSPLLDLVEAEIAFREASYRKAETLADEAIRGLKDDHLLVRAHTRAGQSAHFEGREEDALEHHRRAQSTARHVSDKREALWGEFVCAMELEQADCAEVLTRLEALGSDTATDAVRIANGRMLSAIRDGSGIDPNLFSAVHRLPRVDDPLVRSSFLHVWSCVLTLTGRYAEALDATDQQLRDAEQYRLAFVLPHTHIRRALALRGLRKFRDALDYLTKAQHDRVAIDDYVALAAQSARIGIYLAMGDVEAALEIAEPALPTSAPANALAELVATRALALACAGREAEAERAATRSRSLSSAAEPRLLARLAVAVAEVSRSSPKASSLAADAFADVVRSGNIDAFVTAYRGSKRLLAEVALNNELHGQLGTILSNANDLKYALPALPDLRSFNPAGDSLLSPREREVLGLVSQGLRNREIGQQLFISEVTVKAHVRNIMKKLGARSRAHAVSLGNRLD